MANTNAPDGFTPAYHMSGGVIRPSEFAIASGTNASIFSGDVVNLSSGLVIQGTATGTPTRRILRCRIPSNRWFSSVFEHVDCQMLQL